MYMYMYGGIACDINYMHNNFIIIQCKQGAILVLLFVHVILFSLPSCRSFDTTFG